MKKKLQGIALLIFGVILALVGIASQLLLPGAEQMLWCLAGIGCGVAGLVLVFIKDEQ